LSTREWNSVARRLYANTIQPEELLHIETSQLFDLLDQDEPLIKRITALLSRSGSLAI